MTPLKPPILHTGAIGDAYEEWIPLTAYQLENPQLEYQQTVTQR